ncbi:MAG: SET domain-containing protein [Chitinivibrionales bacterium]|nr:SET domain-containing protein [Chitinivibrionales bacterium]
MDKSRKKENAGGFSVKKSFSGLGLYANCPIKKNKFVIEYTGNLLTKHEANKKGGKYLFEINSRWTIDGSGRKNISRYINHSCRPNCEVRIRDKHIKIHSLKNIKAGEELTYNYGKEYFDEFIKPFGCKCDYCKMKKNKTISK